MDRLSDLPEELLVDITSRLDAHEAVRLSVVQKRQSFLQDIVKQVHSLTLASVVICCDLLNSPVLNLSSRRMERLVLFECQGYHNFSVLRLKSCKLTSLVIDDGTMLIEKAPCGLTLNSPSLKMIYLKGSLFHNYSLIHLSSIKVACFLTSINFEDENLFQQCFNKVLRGLHKVQSLTLSADAFEVYNQALLFRCTFPRLLLVNIYDFVESEDVSNFMLSLKEKAPILMKVSTKAPILMNASIN